MARTRRLILTVERIAVAIALAAIELVPYLRDADAAPCVLSV
ncbi:MAG TPA: hypothetical protein VGJ57_11375 [Nitrospirales bacterium]|jgi:hypothetical protein